MSPIKTREEDEDEELIPLRVIRLHTQYHRRVPHPRSTLLQQDWTASIAVRYGGRDDGLRSGTCMGICGQRWSHEEDNR